MKSRPGISRTGSLEVTCERLLNGPFSQQTGKLTQRLREHELGGRPMTDTEAALTVLDADDAVP
jgi:hypothetical protein